MIPLQCEFLALHGISLLMKTVDLVKKRLNPELEITGVIPCMYDVRKGLARDVVLEIEKHFGNKVFKSKIRANVRLAEAPSHGKSIFDYAPDSYGAEDYLALGREVVGIEMIQKPATEAPAGFVSIAEAPPAPAADVPTDAAPPAPLPVIAPPAPEPAVAAPAEEGLVEFIELIPLEIEDLPIIESPGAST